MCTHCENACRVVTTVLLQAAMNRLLVPIYACTSIPWVNSYSRFSDKVVDNFTKVYMFEIVAMVNTFIYIYHKI